MFKKVEKWWTLWLSEPGSTSDLETEEHTGKDMEGIYNLWILRGLGPLGPAPSPWVSPNIGCIIANVSRFLFSFSQYSFNLESLHSSLVFVLESSRNLFNPRAWVRFPLSGASWYCLNALSPFSWSLKNLPCGTGRALWEGTRLYFVDSTEWWLGSAT